MGGPTDASLPNPGSRFLDGALAASGQADSATRIANDQRGVARTDRAKPNGEVDAVDVQPLPRRIDGGRQHGRACRLTPNEPLRRAPAMADGPPVSEGPLVRATDLTNHTEPSCEQGRGQEANAGEIEPRARPAWIRGPYVDVANALAWVPFVLAAHFVEGDRAALNLLIAGVLLLSFVHQPLTVALVYGDPQEYRLHRRLFTWAPLVLVAAIVIGQAVSLMLVAAVAGLWNAEHTLLQRYGLTRIYGRKVGDDHGGLERWMLQSWLLVVLAWVAVDARTPGFLARLNLGANNAGSVQALTSLRPLALVLLPPLAVTAGVLVVCWLRAEHRRGRAANPAKHLYLASTAVLFVLTLVDPIAGLAGYVAAHSIEYFMVVHGVLGKKYRTGVDGGLLGRAVRARTGAAGFLAGYVVVIAAVLFASQAGTPSVVTVVFLTLGGMHLLYDGFIWKLRRAAVASSLNVSVQRPV